MGRRSVGVLYICPPILEQVSTGNLTHAVHVSHALLLRNAGRKQLTRTTLYVLIILLTGMYEQAATSKDRPLATRPEPLQLHFGPQQGARLAAVTDERRPQWRVRCILDDLMAREP